MSTPCLAAMAPTVSPGTTVYRFGSPAGAGAGSGAGAGAGSGAGGGAGSAAGAGGAGAPETASEAASAAGWASAAAAAFGTSGNAAAATCPTVVVPWSTDAGGPARAPTPTAATTAAVAMPAHSLLLMAGRPVVISVRGSSVAKLLLGPSGMERYGWFMGSPSGSVQPGRSGALRRAGRIEGNAPAATADAGPRKGAGWRHPHTQKIRRLREGRDPGKQLRGTAGTVFGPRNPESRKGAP